MNKKEKKNDYNGVSENCKLFAIKYFIVTCLAIDKISDSRILVVIDDNVGIDDLFKSCNKVTTYDINISPMCGKCCVVLYWCRKGATNVKGGGHKSVIKKDVDGLGD